MKKKVKLFTTIASLALAVALMAFGVYAAVTSASVSVTVNVTYTAAANVKATVEVIEVKTTGESSGNTLNQNAAAINKKATIGLDTTANPAPLALEAHTFAHDGTSANMTYTYKVKVTNLFDVNDQYKDLYVTFTTVKADADLVDANKGKGHSIVTKNADDDAVIAANSIVHLDATNTTVTYYVTITVNANASLAQQPLDTAISLSRTTS